jgi:hypothetical protein
MNLPRAIAREGTAPSPRHSVRATQRPQSWSLQPESCRKPSTDAGYQRGAPGHAAHFSGPRPTSGPNLGAGFWHACTHPKTRNPATCGIRRWRDPDSNRGHHDFQSWDQTSLTGPKSLVNSGFLVMSPGEGIVAICDPLRCNWVPRSVLVPNACRALEPATGRKDRAQRVPADSPQRLREGDAQVEWRVGIEFAGVGAPVQLVRGRAGVPRGDHPVGIDGHADRVGGELGRGAHVFGRL